MVLLLKFQFQILSKELKCPSRKLIATPRPVSEAIFDVPVLAEFLADCTCMNDPSWHCRGLKNCLSEPSQPTKLWEIIYVCYFKSLSFEDVCHIAIDNRYRPTFHIFSPGLHGLTMSSGLSYSFLSFLVVSQTQASHPQGQQLAAKSQCSLLHI